MLRLEALALELISRRDFVQQEVLVSVVRPQEKPNLREWLHDDVALIRGVFPAHVAACKPPFRTLQENAASSSHRLELFETLDAMLEAKLTFKRVASEGELEVIPEILVTVIANNTM